MNPFDAQLNRQHLAAILAHIQGLSAAPVMPVSPYNVPSAPQSYALPGGPPQGAYTLPSAPPADTIGMYDQFVPADITDPATRRAYAEATGIGRGGGGIADQFYNATGESDYQNFNNDSLAQQNNTAG